MVKKVLALSVLGIFLIGSAGFLYNGYRIPTLVPDNYNCEEHPGIISDSNPFFLESGQHYINRKGIAIQKQLERVCN